jgi:hypothetical protein
MQKLSPIEIGVGLMAGISGILGAAADDIGISVNYAYIGLFISAGLGGWLMGKRSKKS